MRGLACCGLVVAAFASLSAGVSACSASDEERLDDPPVVRPGVSRIWSSPVMTSDQYLRAGGPPHILDVARDGKRIVLLYTRVKQEGFNASDVSVSAGMMRSEDDGATWSDHPFVREAEGFGDHGTGYAYPYAIFFHGGKLYALWEYEGDRAHRIAIRSVDFAPGEAVLTLHAGNQQTFSFARHRGELATFVSYGGGDSVEYEWTRFGTPPAVVETKHGSRPYEVIGCHPGEYSWRLGVGVDDWFFVGDCVGEDPKTKQDVWCVEHVSPLHAMTPGRGCVPYPGDATDTNLAFRKRRPFGAPGLNGWLYADAGAVKVARIAGTGASARLDVLTVATGESPNNGWYLSDKGRRRNRYGDLVPVVERLPDDGTRTKLYRFSRADDAFVPSGIPSRPCADGVDCGWRPWAGGRGENRFDALVDWAEPLGGDEYLVFYFLDELRPSLGKHRIGLYMSRERINGPATPRTPAGDLERACALDSACRGGGSFGHCVSSGLETQAANASLDRKYQAALAARTCKDVLGAHHGEACAAGSGRVCRGTEQYVCGGTTLERTWDCATSGATCSEATGEATCTIAACAGTTTPACSSDGTLACSGEGAPELGVDCGALGTTCAMHEGAPQCVRPAAACHVAGEIVCEGALSVWCLGEGVANASARDCSRVPEFSCVDGQCRPKVTVCTEASTVPSCDASTLVYCYEGSLRGLDCGALGGACTVVEGRAQCSVP